MKPEPLEWVGFPGDETELARSIAALRIVLRAYVLSILPHKAGCDDVVQETMIFLWDRRAEYREDTNLKAWAFKVAWFKSMAYRRDRAREERVVCFSDDILHKISQRVEEKVDHIDSRVTALRHCLSQLSADEVRLLQLKYVEEGSLTDYARMRAENPNRLQKAISRLRLRLRHCILSKISR